MRLDEALIACGKGTTGRAVVAAHGRWPVRSNCALLDEDRSGNRKVLIGV
ncbi:hypothetical protein SAMN02787149_11510 [Pseudomonas sp. Snoq117.2]|nr:hypothetical protein SAMN02787149_11510 [Pseudomonas sp. Snoq117.2]